jgi:hypothetical protein
MKWPQLVKKKVSLAIQTLDKKNYTLNEPRSFKNLAGSGGYVQHFLSFSLSSTSAK